MSAMGQPRGRFSHGDGSFVQTHSNVIPSEALNFISHGDGSFVQTHSNVIPSEALNVIPSEALPEA